MSTLPMNRSRFSFLLIALPLLTASTAHAQTAAVNSYVAANVTLAQFDPPRTDRLPNPSPLERGCNSYASTAVSEYEKMRQYKECFTPNSPRWQANHRNHYQWCMTARPEWLTSETAARDRHLVRCGVRKSF